MKLNEKDVAALFKGLVSLGPLTEKAVPALCHKLLEDPQGQCYHFSSKRGEGFTLNTWASDRSIREEFANSRGYYFWRYVQRLAPYPARAIIGEFEPRRLAMTPGDVIGTVLQYELREVCPQYRDQAWVLERIYKMVYPEWEWIEKLDGYVKCNQRTWKAISKMWMEYDHRFHPNLLAGGAWMNSGFSGHDAEHLKDWHVQRAGFSTLDGAYIPGEAA